MASYIAPVTDMAGKIKENRLNCYVKRINIVIQI